MKQNIFDENQLRSFLLGELSENEQTNIAQAAFADEDLLAHLQTVENDLIDEYVRGEITQNEKQNFERMFLTSAERKQKIEFAQAFTEFKENNAALTQTGKLASKFERKDFWQTVFPNYFKPQLAFAAIALFVLLIGWLIFFDSGKGKTEIAEQNNVNAILSPTPNQTTNNVNNQTANRTSISPNVSPTSGTTSAPDKPNQNKQNNTQPTSPKPAPSIKPNAPARTFAALIFPIGMTRDDRGKLLQLNLPANVRNARLIFNLEKGDEYKDYQIQIRNRSGANAFESTARRSGQTVIVSIPAARLAAGKYETVLRGASKDQSQTIGYYDFEIVKP